MGEILVLSERIKNLIQLRESHFREFKSAYEGRPDSKRPRRIVEVCRDVAEALVAFANADGGDLIIGVEDDGTITGVPYSYEDIATILEAPKTHVYQNTQLPIQMATSLEIDGYKVLFLSVDKGFSEIYQLSDGRCVRRYGTSTMPASVDKILFDRQESRSRGYDSEFVDSAQVSDLDFKLLIEMSERYLKGISPEKYLQQIGLAEYSPGGLRLKRASLLLFAKDIQRWHPRCQVRIIKVHGNALKAGGEYNVTSDEFVQGNIFDLLVRSWEELRPFLAYKTQFSHDIRFEQSYTYPEWACREALVNAIAHRDYVIQNSIDIFIFDDRMEIKSPGALLSTITVDQLLKLEGVHESRNSLVARALRESGYMRELGEGMKRIFRLMEESDLQAPYLHSHENSFVVTLFNKSVFNDQQLAWLGFFDDYNLSRLQQRIVVAGMNERVLSPENIYRAMNTTDRNTYDKEVTYLRTLGVLKETMANSKATHIARQSGRPKQSIPRFRVVEPLVQAQLVANKIVVFGLPIDATITDIKDALKGYGTIEDIYIPIAKEGYETKYAFVTFREPNVATRIIADRQAFFIRDYPLTIKIYKNKEQ